MAQNNYSPKFVRTYKIKLKKKQMKTSANEKLEEMCIILLALQRKTEFEYGNQIDTGGNFL